MCLRTWSASGGRQLGGLGVTIHQFTRKVMRGRSGPNGSMGIRQGKTLQLSPLTRLRAVVEVRQRASHAVHQVAVEVQVLVDLMEGWEIEEEGILCCPQIPLPPSTNLGKHQRAAGRHHGAVAVAVVGGLIEN